MFRPRSTESVDPARQQDGGRTSADVERGVYRLLEKGAEPRHPASSHVPNRTIFTRPVIQLFIKHPSAQRAAWETTAGRRVCVCVCVCVCVYVCVCGPGCVSLNRLLQVEGHFVTHLALRPNNDSCS
ncbi:hypothetical protein EYF80_067252 [Liparis tanakae]|uniref:Uncharacterized protein n=1 Tax=Liparis tanakae TaxID=230148 RepID=A0A4Z2E1R2_9TELE|nr:hypothetical protein EYF80_067252 [Liparis tanakae]